MTHTVTLWPPKKWGIAGYLKTINMNTRGDVLVPVSIVTAAGDGLGSCARTAPVWTFNGLTCAAFGEYKHLRHYTSATNPELDVANPIIDLCLYQIAGAPCLLVSYGAADFIDSYDNTGTPTAADATKVTYMTVAGADLYGVCDLGLTSTWQISKCPYPSTPLTATNWSDGIPVGTAAWPIVQLRQIRGGVVAAKGDGLYVWNPNRDFPAYENLLPWLERCPDPLNGVGMFAVKGGVCYPTADGSLYHFDGYTVSDISPKKYHIPHPYNAHLRSRITAGVESGDWLYAATEPCSVGWTHNAGIKVFVYVADTDTYTDITTNTTDGLPSTSGSIAAVGSSAGGGVDYLYVGSDYPFLAVRLLVGTPNSATAVPLTVGYSRVGGSWASIGSNLSDTTVQAGVTFSRDGVVAIWPIASGGVPAAAVVNSETKYWWRFGFTSALSAGTTLKGVAILPARRLGSGNEQLLLWSDHEGRRSHILAGKPTSEGWEWHDLVAFDKGTPIDAMAYGTGFTGASATPEASMLLAVGQYDRDGAFVGVGGGITGYSLPAGSYSSRLFPAPQDLADEGYLTAVKKATKYRIVNNYVMQDDTVDLQQRWDHKVWDTVAEDSRSGPIEIQGLPSRGLRLETMLSLTDNDDDSVNGPSISAVEVDIEVLENVSYEQIQEHDETTPLSE